MLYVIMIVTLKTKATLKLLVIEKTTLEKPDMVLINLKVDRHRVDLSRIFKLTVMAINRCNMINLEMQSNKTIKIDFKITLINNQINNSSSNNQFSLLLTITTHKQFMKIRELLLSYKAILVLLWFLMFLTMSNFLQLLQRKPIILCKLIISSVFKRLSQLPQCSNQK